MKPAAPPTWHKNNLQKDTAKLAGFAVFLVAHFFEMLYNVAIISFLKETVL